MLGSQPADANGARPDEFLSWRLGEINLVITVDQSFYDRFAEATDEATRRNLLDKVDRIALFQLILYGNSGLDSIGAMA